MDRTVCFAWLSQAREQGLRPKDYVAKLGIDAGHLSKILHGKFKKVDGRADQVCKFAKKYVIAREVSNKQLQQLAEEMGRLGVKLTYRAPEAEKLVCELMGTLFERSGGGAASRVKARSVGWSHICERCYSTTNRLKPATRATHETSKR